MTHYLRRAFIERVAKLPRREARTVIRLVLQLIAERDERRERKNASARKRRAAS
jgi:hypothetical protein